MIKHVVMWKLRSVDVAAKADAFSTIATSLNSLVPLIPEIKSLTVGRNVANPDTNWDLVLVAQYNSLEDLAIYQGHPEHVKVAAIINELVSAKAAVDFEL